MNYMDAMLIILVILAIINSMYKGFIIAFTELVVWLGGLVLSVLMYPYISLLVKKLITNSMVSVFLSLLLVIVLIGLLCSLIINRLFTYIPVYLHQHPVNKMLGLIPGLINGLVYAAIATAFLKMLPLQSNNQATFNKSILASYLHTKLHYPKHYLKPVFNDIAKIPFEKITTKTGSDKFIKLPFKVERALVRSDLEAKMLFLINTERKKVNLKPLKADAELTLVARAHSDDMFQRAYFSHYTPENKDPFDRIRAANITFLAAGENLALAQTLTMAHQNLINSPGHKANILHQSFGRVGIGVLDGGFRGLMITQNFRN